MSSNLPPGVTESMLPGNRPEDIEFEKMCEELGTLFDKFNIKYNEEEFTALTDLLWEHR